MARNTEKKAGIKGGERPLSVDTDARWSSEHPQVTPRGMPVQDVMTAEVFIVAPGNPVSQAARLMRDNDIGFLPVVDAEDGVVGVLTDRDLVLQVLAEQRPATTPVEDVMTEEVVTCHAGDDIALCEHLMRENQVRRMVVLGDDDQLAGVVSLADLAQSDAEAQLGAVVADVTVGETDRH